MQPILNIALRASRQACEYMTQTIDKNDPKPSESYANAKLISHLEDSLHQNFYDALKKANPTHFIVGLGETLDKPKDDSWHINNIHNSEHLLRKLPSCAYSVLHKHQGKAQNTLLVCPFSDLEFTATRGSGAALNGRRIRCSDTKTLGEAVVATNALKQFSQTENKQALTDFTSDLASQVKEVLSGHCDALDIAMVASGQIDAAILSNVSYEDVESALLLCQEAGVLTGTYNGMPFSSKEDKLIVANPKLFKHLVQKFNHFQNRI